jgi:hypothetical protein
MMAKTDPHPKAWPAFGFAPRSFKSHSISCDPIVWPLWRAVDHWIEAGGMRMSAAMSFYGILSLAPLLVLLVAVLGWWLDRSYIEVSLVDQIRSVIGAQGAQVVQQALSSAQAPSEGITASLFAFALLLSGATGVFAELQDAFERLWRQGSGEAPQQKWWHSASLRLRGVAYILAFGFLLLVSLAISTFLGLLSGWAGSYLPVEADRLGAQRSRVFRFLRRTVCGPHEDECGPQTSFTLSGDGVRRGGHPVCGWQAPDGLLPLDRRRGVGLWRGRLAGGDPDVDLFFVGCAAAGRQHGARLGG